MRLAYPVPLFVWLMIAPLATAQQRETLPEPVAQAAPDACPQLPCAAPAGGPRLWVDAEYLLWWTKNSPSVIPVVTTTSGTLSESAGVLGQPGTSVVLGGHEFDLGTRSGARFSGGFWCDEDGTLGLEGNYFFLASRTQTHEVVSNGQTDAPVLFFPFINLDTNQEQALAFAAPHVLASSALLRLTSRLQGAELDGVVQLGAGCNGRVVLLGGFRFLDLNERLTSAFVLNGVPRTSDAIDGGPAGLVVEQQSQVNTRNLFYGGQLGVRAEWERGRLIARAQGEVALGTVEEVVNAHVSSATNLFSGGQNGSFVGQPVVANDQPGIRHTRDRFAVVPEARVDVGVRLLDGLRVFVGYDFLYLSEALRPGDQVSRVAVSPFIQNNGPPRTLPTLLPQFSGQLHGTDFWAQGLTFSIELRY